VVDFPVCMLPYGPEGRQSRIVDDLTLAPECTAFGEPLDAVIKPLDVENRGLAGIRRKARAGE
jgi:hypothetical protein